MIHNSRPFYHQESFLSSQRDPEGLPVSEQHAAMRLSIHYHPQMSNEDMQNAIDAVDRFRVG